MDGRAASLKAKEYLIALHGDFGVISFQIENLEYDEQSTTWAVICSFFTNLMGNERVQYDVKVSDDGSIKSAKKLVK